MLDTDDLSFARLGRLLRQLPADAALWRSVNGAEETAWTLDRQLAAAAVDALRVANWQRGSGKKKDRPKPIPRPGVGPTTTRTGNTAGMSPVDVRALLDSFKPPPP